MAEEPRIVDPKDLPQQDRTVTQLEVDGWIAVPQATPPQDGSILMQLTTSEGVSHIIVMLNGDRVDAKQKLGKTPAVPNPGQP